MSTDQKTFLAIDIGQSGSRVRSSDGFNFSDGPAFDRSAGVLAAVEATLISAGHPRADVLALSLTGVRGQVPDPTDVGSRCYELTGATSVALADDGYACLVGALAGRDGLAVSVGSGVVAVAQNNHTVSHRDGDGPVLGDDGGGFWIGREGLRAAVRAYEDRGEKTRLLKDLEEKYGSIYSAVREKSDDEAMKWCLEVTPIVLKAAAQGDGVAQQIRESAISLLVETLASTWRAVGDLNQEILASYTGGVLNDAEFLTLFQKSSEQQLPHISWQTPLGDNTDGAMTIARYTPENLQPLLRWWHR